MKEKIDEVAKVSTELLDELIEKLSNFAIKNKSTLEEIKALQSMILRSIKIQTQMFEHLQDTIEAVEKEIK